MGDRLTQNLTGGLYRFILTVDDGARLWIGDRLLIDTWKIQSPREYTADIYLDGGPTTITLDYFEESLGAIVQFEWEKISTISTGWRGEYFNNLNLIGEPVIVRQDPTIDFDWGESSPSPTYIDPNQFSVRWERTLDIQPAGTYEFTVVSDDGVRLWVNGDLLIDAWQLQDGIAHNISIGLPGGPTTVRLDYFENNDDAEVELRWRYLP